MKLTINDLYNALNEDIIYGFDYTKDGGSKKLIHNPYTAVDSLYINGVLTQQFIDSNKAIEAFNKIK